MLAGSFPAAGVVRRQLVSGLVVLHRDPFAGRESAELLGVAVSADNRQRRRALTCPRESWQLAVNHRLPRVLGAASYQPDSLLPNQGEVALRFLTRVRAHGIGLCFGPRRVRIIRGLLQC